MTRSGQRTGQTPAPRAFSSGYRFPRPFFLLPLLLPFACLPSYGKLRETMGNLSDLIPFLRPLKA